jgi:threonine dehydrogenase-like Zn-dependent dehydrogenase
VRAFQLIENQPVLTADYPDPVRSVGQALVRPLFIMITPADLGATRNPDTQGVLGNQFVGIVEDSDRKDLIGQRVVADVNITDPASTYAQRGLGHHDPERKILGLRSFNGCLCERFMIPDRNLVIVPDEIESERAVFAAQLAAAIHVSRVQRVEGKTFVTVLGGDLMALLCAQIMGTLNTSVRMITGRSDRLELCAKWGVKHRNLGEVGRRADQDIVINTMSEPDSIATSLRMVRPRGALILQSHPTIGIEEQSIAHNDLSLIIERELRIYGSRCGQISDGLDALQSGRVDLSGLITKRVHFSEVMAGMRASIEPQHIGVLVQMD